MGLERIVRPFIPPFIRPASIRPKALDDDAERGFCILSGSSNRLIDLSISDQSSFSRSKTKETKRRFDEARIYQKDDDGNVNRDNFVDVEAVNKVWMRHGDGTQDTRRYANIEESDNVEILRRNVIRINT